MKTLGIILFISISCLVVAQENGKRVSASLGAELRFNPIRLTPFSSVNNLDLSTPEVDFKLQNSGLPLMLDVGIRSYKLKGSVQFTVHLRYDHIAFDSQSPDTLWYNTYTGKSIDGFLIDYGLYLSKDLFRIRSRPLAIEAGFMWLNKGAKVLYTSNLQLAPGYHFQITDVWSPKYVAMSTNLTYSSDHFKYKFGANLLEGVTMPYRRPYYNYLAIRISVAYRLPLGELFKRG
jgi:hypothetical protein